jgi:hypothetical protein
VSKSQRGYKERDQGGGGTEEGTCKKNRIKLDALGSDLKRMLKESLVYKINARKILLDITMALGEMEIAGNGIEPAALSLQ